MFKLYMVREGGLDLVRTFPSSSEAGHFVFNLGVTSDFFYLLQDGRLYNYVDSPDGFGWEGAEGDDGPSFI